MYITHARGKNMDWNRLLSEETPVPSGKRPSSWEDYPLDASDRDYMEIICSSAFRRLQDKSQLYLINRSDFVRTRLTHSMEVSSIGKMLGGMITKNTKKNGIEELKSNSDYYDRKLSSVLSCAGLLHDIGNPPFGHKGEDAISGWFKNALSDDSFTFKGKPVREWLNDQMIEDLRHFDGNAQVLRILSRPGVDSANISFAVISSLIKYPVSSLEADRSRGDVRLKKGGYFYSENEFIKIVREATGVGSAEEPFARHPLTFLLEAADDIAYVISDLEDAVDRKHITVPQLAAFLEDELGKIPSEGDELHELQLMATHSMLRQLKSKLETVKTESDDMVIHAFQSWTKHLRGWLMYVTAYSFALNYDSIMEGTFKGDIFDDGHHKYTVQILKAAIREYVYPSKAVSEIMAFNVIDYLIGRYASAIVNWDTDEEMDTNDNLVILSIPKDRKARYMQEKTGDEGTDLYLRFRMVIDFISDMTDEAATELYRSQNGIL